MKINKGNYENFLSYLEAVTHICTNIEIVGGKLRQFAEGKLAIIDADLNKIFPEPIDLRLVMLKTKLPLLSIFTKTDTTDIGLELVDNNMKIFDDYSHINIRQASKEFISHGFIDDASMANKVNIDFEKDSIASMTLPQILVKRIDSIATWFQAMYLCVNVKNGKASFDLTSYSKTDNSSVVKNIPINSKEDIQFMFSVYPLQTKFDGDIEINLASRLVNEKRNVILKVVGSVKDIPTTYYIKGTVIK